MDVQDTYGENAVAAGGLMKDQGSLSVSQTNMAKMERWILPAAGVLVVMSAGEALITTPSPQDPPGLLSTADLNPSEV